MVHATFLPRASLKAHFSDKQGSNGIRQGGTRVKWGRYGLSALCLRADYTALEKETLNGLLTTLIVVYSKHTSLYTQAETTLIDYLLWQGLLSLSHWEWLLD